MSEVRIFVGSPHNPSGATQVYPEIKAEKSKVGKTKRKHKPLKAEKIDLLVANTVVRHSVDPEAGPILLSDDFLFVKGSKEHRVQVLGLNGNKRYKRLAAAIRERVQAKGKVIVLISS